jgi:hypothetical protein
MTVVDPKNDQIKLDYVMTVGWEIAKSTVGIDCGD